MQQWIKAPLDFFWNRIGKKEITQQSLGGAIEAQGWESFGFSQLEVTWFVFLALPHGHCCARRTALASAFIPQSPTKEPLREATQHHFQELLFGN